MPRWEPDSEARLRQAALELFEERGYEDTTVVEIAERAGVTKRTFFRYFADKREVLFSDPETFENNYAEGILNAPDGAGPLEAIGAGLDRVATFLEGRGELAVRRQAILDATPELEERERSKLAQLAEAGARALHERGVEEPAATLAAESGIVILRTAFARWVSEKGKGDLHRSFRESLGTLRALSEGVESC